MAIEGEPLALSGFEAEVNRRRVLAHMQASHGIGQAEWTETEWPTDPDDFPVMWSKARLRRFILETIAAGQDIADSEKTS